MCLPECNSKQVVCSSLWQWHWDLEKHHTLWHLDGEQYWTISRSLRGFSMVLWTLLMSIWCYYLYLRTKICVPLIFQVTCAHSYSIAMLHEHCIVAWRGELTHVVTSVLEESLRIAGVTVKPAVTLWDWVKACYLHSLGAPTQIILACGTLHRRWSCGRGHMGAYKSCSLRKSINPATSYWGWESDLHGDLSGGFPGEGAIGWLRQCPP